MSDNDLILELSKLIDAKIKPIQDKLEDIDIKLESLQLESKIQKRENRKDFSRIYDGLDTLVEVLETKGILPKAE